MQKPARQFLDLLESQQLLAPDILGELRRQVDESKSRLTSDLIARLLVDNGHLTKFQATKLIAELKDQTAKDLSHKGSSSSAADASEDELGFAEDAPDLQRDSSNPDKSSHVAKVFLDDEEDGNSAAKPANALPVEVVPVQAVPAEKTPQDARLVEVVPAAPVTPLKSKQSKGKPKVTSASASASASATAAPLAKPQRAQRLPASQTAKSNPYDSFRILGVGLLLALVLVAGFFLVNYFWRGNADQRLQAADEAYEQRSYESATIAYREFAEVFPANEKASYAKVRAVLAAIRQNAEGAPDPKLGLDTALKSLPGLVGEAALAEQQSDLAGVLIALAGKFNERADRTQDTAQRKQLMTDMDKLLALINDPQFVGTNQRNQQAPTLDRIQEDRQRILREINRDEELAAALAEMDVKLAAQDAMAAYEIRKALISRYPLLEVDAGLAQRVQQASALERTLVKPSTLDVELSVAPPQSAIARSFILANRTGPAAVALRGQVVFVKAKGSIYGLDGESGQILWRHFVGQSFPSQPLRIEGADATTDAIVCQAEQGIISRLTGTSGEPLWTAKLSAAMHNPTLAANELFVATLDGSVAELDATTGELQWATQLPQPASTAPAIPQANATENTQLYVPADHSNLYGLSRDDGSCSQVLYLGHRSGSIVVPPIWLLDQLFVFENISSQNAKIRILSTTSSGLELQETQNPLTMEGNIVTPPQIDGRRLIVQSDVGQIKVLDVEPTAKSQRVSELVTVPRNASQPKQSWLLADNNRVWVADQYLTRFDVQVATLNMSRAWIKHDGDRFVAPPQRLGNTLIHARTQRGTQGIRITASDADSGETFWETDLAIPVSYIGASGAGYEALNTSGMLYALGNKPIRGEADENPGQGKQMMLFEHSTKLSDGRVALINTARGNQLAILSSNSPKIKLLSVNFGSAQATCPPVAVDDKLAACLDSGQLVLVDLGSGAIAGTPYQPAVQAGQKVHWNTPAYLPQSQTLIASSDLQSLVRLSTENGLRALNEVTLSNPLVGPLVAVGEQVCAIETTGGGDKLVFFDPTSLQRGASWPLPGHLVAGPYATEQGCLIQTDSKLALVSTQGQPQWTLDFPASPLVAGPLVVEGNWSVATQSGQIWMLNASDGQVLGQADAGQSLSSPMLQLGASLLIGSDEGAVLALPIPSAKFPSPAAAASPASSLPAESP